LLSLRHTGRASYHRFLDETRHDDSLHTPIQEQARSDVQAPSCSCFHVICGGKHAFASEAAGLALASRAPAESKT